MHISNETKTIRRGQKYWSDQLFLSWFGASQMETTFFALILIWKKGCCLNIIFFVEGLSGEIQFWSITKYKIDQFRLLMEINIFLSDSAYRTMRYVLHQFKVNSKWKNDAIKNEWDCRKINIIWIFSLPLCRSVRLNCGKQFFFRFQPIV